MAVANCSQTEKDKFFSKLSNNLLKNSVNSGNSLGCVEWQGSTDRYGYGRKRITWPDKSASVERVHRLSYMVKHQLFRHEVPRNDENDPLDVSHLCHNKLCIKSEHLVLERHELNCERKACFLLNHCTLNHFPSCILRPRARSDTV